MTESRFKLAIFSILSLIFILALGLVGDCLYQLNTHLNQLNFQIANGNRELAKIELDYVKYFDGLARRWKIDWLADDYLLSNDKAVLYGVVVNDYLVGDYKRVAESEQLKASNDYRAAHFIGVSRVRLLQAIYKEEKNPAVQKQLLDKLADQAVSEVSPYFKKALENTPFFQFPDPNFNDRLNYDLTSNREAAKRLIENERPQVRFILGIPELPDGDKPGGRKPADGKRLNEESQPGAGGNPKKRG